MEHFLGGYRPETVWKMPVQQKREKISPFFTSNLVQPLLHVCDPDQKSLVWTPH